MGAPELLHDLRGAGLVLTLTPTGGLHVAPRTALTDDHRAEIRTERDALVLALEAEAQREAFEERAAIMEFDAEMTRADAEAAALALLAGGKVQGRVARTCPDCRHFGRRRTCLEPFAARLLTQDQGFGIVWPPAGHAGTCAVFNAQAHQGHRTAVAGINRSTTG